jgi:hypothetical protein
MAALVVLCGSSLVCVWVDNGRDVKSARKALDAFIQAHPGDRFTLDEPLMFDVSVFRGFRVDPRLSVYAENEEGERYIESHRAIYGPVPVIRNLTAVSGAYVAATRSKALDEAPRIPGATLVTTLRPNDRVYYRLLRSALFRKVLVLVRDDYRVRGMQAIVDERIEVYRVP